jgi:hypothetical protein
VTGDTVALVDPQTLEVVKIFGTLVCVGIAALLAWMSGLRFRRLDRRIEGRATLVGALEETIAATVAFSDDLSRWQAGGWGRPETHGDPRLPALTAQNGALSKYLSECRGRLAAARARLIVLTPSTEDLSEAVVLAEDVLILGRRGDGNVELRRRADQLLDRSLKLAEKWRDTWRG